MRRSRTRSRSRPRPSSTRARPKAAQEVKSDRPEKVSGLLRNSPQGPFCLYLPVVQKSSGAFAQALFFCNTGGNRQNTNEEFMFAGINMFWARLRIILARAEAQNTYHLRMRNC